MGADARCGYVGEVAALVKSCRTCVAIVTERDVTRDVDLLETTAVHSG